MPTDKYSRFADLGFEDFRRMAGDETLSPHEKVGFPDEYREGKEAAILEDVMAKLPALLREGAVVLDVGCGCSGLPRMLIRRAAERRQRLLLVDSQEMLAQLPDGAGVEKIAAYYPRCPELFDRHAGRVDAILVYSVLQYVFVEGNLFEFIDRSLCLLAPGGALLLGDIPNVSKRRRFFASEAGGRFHRAFTGRDEAPTAEFNPIEERQIDDAVVISILMRARAAGYQAYVVPQPPSLPMANRREDIVIARD
jgi:cyclopropane fatty-acyl-phospholipid synthase-like methyltransferase